MERVSACYHAAMRRPRREGPWVQGLAHAGLALLWLLLFRDALAHLARIYLRADMSVSAVTLLALALLAMRRAWQGSGGRLAGRLRAALLRGPAWRPMPLLVTALATLSYLVAVAVLDVHVLQDALFGLASFGLVGLWMAPRAWRRAWPVCLLAVATLPFGYHLDTFLGYPLRVATAAGVAEGLGARLEGSGLEAVLSIENRVAQVDLPCSGVKGLWTGSLLLLLAALLRGSGLGWRWWAALLTQSLALVAANFLRVLALAAVGLVWEQPVVAGWLHLPLGVLGFAAACWLGLAVLGGGAGSVDGVEDVDEMDRVDRVDARGRPGVEGSARGAGCHNDAPTAAPAVRAPVIRPESWRLMAGLLLCTVAANLALRPRIIADAGQAPRAGQGWAWPEGWRVEPLPLKASDAAWLTADGAAAVERVRFERQGVSGSAILVLAATWRAHHAPERCFQIYGLKLLSDRALSTAAGSATIRWMALGDDSGRPSHAALTWFQGRDGRIIGDYAARIWADLDPGPQPWVLASVLFDRPVAADDPAALALAAELQGSIAATWQGRIP